MLLAIYFAVGALAAACKASDNNCENDQCDTVGETEICTQCKATYVPINGKCVEATSASNCKNAEGTSQGNQVCGKCEGATFMYKGGCYEGSNALGQAICQAAGVDGVCETCNADNGYFKNPGAAATVDSCISCGDVTGVTTGADSNTKTYKGVANCAKCDAPESLQTSGTAVATCTECNVDLYLKTDSGTTSCVASNACTGSFFPMTDNTKKLCTKCDVIDKGGVADCTTCAPKEGDPTKAKCTACGNSKVPNADGSACVAPAPSACPIEGCKTCSADKTACEECAENKYLTPTGQCIADCAALSGYYGDAASKTCKRCEVANCEACSEQGKCQTCTIGFYKDNTGVCQKCDASCRACSGATNADCTECPSGKALTYGSGDTKGTCGEGCVVNTTQASGNCKVCGLTVEGTAYCSECATPTEYPQNGVCATNTARAATCSDASISGGVCTTCANNYFKMNGGCYETSKYPGKSVCTAVASGGNTCQTAAPGYKVDNSGNLVTCSEGCKACSSSSSCDACADGYVLTNNACSKCDASCLTCETDATKCTECASGYYKSTSGSGACTSCESNSGGVTGVRGCASCAAPTSNSGPVLCYLVEWHCWR
ncbi:Variant-specific surface protein [Giardia duodenalis]|uniref:Variant-specific surface protein n=1 Tax=Giardia intestinalis TaxID=5741 RepID=V6TW68_GIAIN|nr:Variant-specific surface protein [Giardia intestinalis]